MRRLCLAAIWGVFFGAVHPAEAQDRNCRLALALGMDISGSIDAREYRLQLDGLANALLNDAVQRAFFALPDAPVSLAIYEWGGAGQQAVLVDWTVLTDPAQLYQIGARLRRRSSPYSDPSTAIGPAILFGAALLQERPDCWQHTLDISGDGPANSGLDPTLIPSAALEGITVNGLVVVPGSRANTTKNLRNVKTLLEYYRTTVIRGPGAFVETARDFEDFERAMTRKLMRELGGLTLSHKGAQPLPPGAPLP